MRRLPLALAGCAVLASAFLPSPEPEAEITTIPLRSAPLETPGLPTTTTVLEITTTSTEPEPETTTTTEPPVPVTPRHTTTVPTVPPTTIGRQPPASSTTSNSSGRDFWWWLANCESENGRTSDNQFQFMGGTERAVGYYYGAPYEEQRAMAIWWASQIPGQEGTTAGWPHCWWVALAAVA
jgi:hypothetical protein